MNIVCIVTPSHIQNAETVADQLRRHSPNSKLYLIIYNNTLGDDFSSSDKFDFVLSNFRLADKYQGYAMSGHIDVIKMMALDLLGIDEVLYLDTDIVVCGNIDDIPTYATGTISSSLDQLHIPLNQQYLIELSEMYGYPINVDPPYTNSGVLYIKKSPMYFLDKYKGAVKKWIERARNSDINGIEAGLGGQSLINVIERVVGWSQLPSIYNMSWYRFSELKDARIIHFHGRLGKWTLEQGSHAAEQIQLANASWTNYHS